MDEHWQHKKKRSGAMSTPEIDKWYELAMRNGALGGKLIGAGGGGFLLFYAEDKKRLRHAMREAGPRRGSIPIRFRRHQDVLFNTRCLRLPSWRVALRPGCGHTR